MLIELKIENFAIARDIEISLKPGFNVITGESGAGKSLIVEALNFVTGGRVKSSKIAGDSVARVQAVFDFPGRDSEVLSLLQEAGVLDGNEENLVLMRKMLPAGRNIYHVNGVVVTQGIYRSLGQVLVDIHSQRDSQFLLKGENQRKMLDLASGDEAAVLLEDLAWLHSEYGRILGEIRELKDLERERNRRIDWVAHEIEEIEAAKLVVGEDEDLEREKNLLVNAEKISLLAFGVYEALGGEGGAVNFISRAVRDLGRWGEFDPDAVSYCQDLELALEQIQRISGDAKDKGESIHFDQSRLDEIMSRLHLIEGLKRKYGVTIEDILRYACEAGESLENLQGSARRLEELDLCKRGVAKDWKVKAQRLSVIRKESAKRLESAVKGELSDLGMPDVDFSIFVDVSSDNDEGKNSVPNEEGGSFSITAHGLDLVDYRIQPNPGMPMQSVSVIASGGELSRIMLALKGVFAALRGFSTLVLDEIDVGMGGDTAKSVGEKLKEIACHRQVICITHLPVIAAMGDYHYQIEKVVQGGSTNTVLSPISGRERVEEVVRMIAGDGAPGETRRVAEKMLKG